MAAHTDDARLANLKQRLQQDRQQRKKPSVDEIEHEINSGMNLSPEAIARLETALDQGMQSKDLKDALCRIDQTILEFEDNINDMMKIKVE